MTCEGGELKGGWKPNHPEDYGVTVVYHRGPSSEVHAQLNGCLARLARPSGWRDSVAEEARDAYARFLDEPQSPFRKALMGSCYHSIACADPERAYQCDLEAMKHAKDDVERGMAYANLAETLLSMRRFEDAVHAAVLAVRADRTNSANWGVVLLVCVVADSPESRQIIRRSLPAALRYADLSSPDDGLRTYLERCGELRAARGDYLELDEAFAQIDTFAEP